jgi:hypothetical protein
MRGRSWKCRRGVGGGILGRWGVGAVSSVFLSPVLAVVCGLGAPLVAVSAMMRWRSIRPAANVPHSAYTLAAAQ